jgi:hypothetical protein
MLIESARAIGAIDAVIEHLIEIAPESSRE